MNKEFPMILLPFKRLEGVILLGMLFSFLSGCSSFEPVEAPKMFEKHQGFETRSQEQATKPSDIWEIVKQKPDLAKMIETILKKNYQVRQSLADLKQSQSTHLITSAELLPYLSAGLSSTVSQSVSETSAGVVTSQSQRNSLSVSATYQLDLFGENSSNYSASLLELMAQIEEHKGLSLGLFYDFLVAWVELEGAKARIDQLEQTIRNDQENLNFITERYNLGLASLTDVYKARKQVIVSKASKPDYEAAIRNQAFAIRQLLGDLEFVSEDLLTQRISIEFPPVSVGIPSDLISNRPDIKAAFLRIKASNHQVASSIAARYPKFSLTASGGTQSEALGNLVDPGYSFWNLVGNITLPLFDAGKRKSAVEAQKAKLKGRVHAYKSRLFKAFQDTNSRLEQIRLQSEKIDLMNDQITLSELILSEVTSAYLQGLDEWSSVLTAQSSLNSARIQRITAETRLALQKIQLYRTLGAAWPEEMTNRLLRNIITISTDPQE